MEKKSETEMFKMFFEDLPKDIDKVIDLGCGWGKISNLLPKKMNVTGVDKQSFDGRIFDKFIEKDIEDFDFDSNGEYDLIIISRILHLLNDSDKLLKKIQDKTPKGKYNLIITLDEYNPSSEEITKYYLARGWKKKKSLNFLIPYDTHRGKVKPHRHTEVMQLFQKIN